MKYKVIETAQGKVLVDETAEININNFITDGYLVWKWLDNSSLLGRKKVIATINFSLDKDIPMVIVEDEIEKLALNYSKTKSNSKLFRNTYIRDFKAGYKASQKLYSEEDLETAHLLGCIFAYGKQIATKEERLNHFKDCLKELEQEYIELEMEWSCSRENCIEQSPSCILPNDGVCKAREIIKIGKGENGQLIAYLKQ